MGLTFKNKFSVAVFFVLLNILLGLSVEAQTDFSELIGHFQNPSKRKVLDLQYQRLEKLSKEIVLFKNLEWFQLTGNQITTLPREIGTLTRLKGLYLAENQLTVLPDEIGQLQNLKELFLFYNYLSYLPKLIGNLKAL
ncbi:leucine-rich repeat domain-containing protein [Leptospira weilii]|nr:hypothetical protein [Leptospira weilii]EMN88224.1 leucine rich repeat protein [Leptospira weilii str. UI 13098]OMI14741.1 hypothetical protein BUQ74_20505 [Leptospira weilii serovar Heyan]